MKKLRLKALDLGAREILSREQLKGIVGGSCLTANDCPASDTCSAGQCVYVPGSEGRPNDGSGDEHNCPGGMYPCAGRDGCWDSIVCSATGG